MNFAMSSCMICNCLYLYILIHVNCEQVRTKDFCEEWHDLKEGPIHFLRALLHHQKGVMSQKGPHHPWCSVVTQL